MGDTDLKFCIIGYYGHCNLGDEQYKQSFMDLFKQYMPTSIKYQTEFYDCDMLQDYTFSETDIIILGGGDVLNDYFLHKVISVFTGRNNKIIAVSVGLPFTSVLTDTNKLNIVDYIFIRTKQDLELFSQYFHPHRVFYLPDLSMLLLNKASLPVISEQITSTMTRIERIKRSGKKIVMFSLSRHIYNSNYETNYQFIITTLCQFIKFLTTFNYHIVFVPFNTNSDNPIEDDTVVQQDIVSYLLQNGNVSLTNTTIINTKLTTDEVLKLLDLVDVSVCMRFHACLFSVYKKVPIFPIFTTRKIKNLLLDLEWQYGYEMDTNDDHVPIEIDVNTLMTRFVGLAESLKSRDAIKDKLALSNMKLFNDSFHNTVHKFIDILIIPYSKQTVQSLQTQYRSNIDEKIANILKSIQDFARENGYNDFRNVDDEHLQDVIVSIVSYHLTNGSINSIYNYGLKTKMFNGMTYNYIDEWKWISRDILQRKYNTILMNNPHGLFNLGFVDQVDYSGAHRSGWQFVYDNIKYLHKSNSDLIMDLYVDRTFHWNLQVGKLLGVVPYKQNWMGFVHHTFETAFSEYNCFVLLECPEFLQSLKFCKGIFVLSEYLAQQMRTELLKIGFGNVPVYVLVHPTDTNVEKFTMTKFYENKDKKLLHVGGWLRNIYTFYNLSIPKNIEMKEGKGVFGFKCKFATQTYDIILRKVALRGKNMGNYYPQHDFLDKLHSILSRQVNSARDRFNIQQNISQNASGNISGNTSSNASGNASNNISQNASQNDGPHTQMITNNWYKHFYDDVCDKIKSVDYIDYLQNDDFDKLLSSNIVFVHLVDASAVNTVIECMVRNTPIILNKHPAVVELLGERYPLYFSNTCDYFTINKEVETLLTDGYSIRRAYEHLKNIDKTSLSIQYFVNQLIDILKRPRT